MNVRKFKIKRTKNEELVKKLHKETFPADQWCEGERNVYWIVWEGKKPVGFAVLSETDDGFASLDRFGVKKCARGNSLQVRMLRVCDRYCKTHGFKKAISYTKMDNIPSIRSFQKTNYLMYIPQYEYADKDCIYWMKEFDVE